MPNATYSRAIREAYACAKEVVLDTLALVHPGVEGGAVYMVRAKRAFELGLETGETKTFEPVGFNFTLPPTGPNGPQDLSVEIDNIDRRISDFLNEIKEHRSEARLSYRAYLTSDLKKPQNNPVLNLNLTDVKVTISKVIGRATFADLINKKHPRELYTRWRFPSLGGG